MPDDVSTTLDKWLGAIPGRMCFTETLKVYVPTGYGDLRAQKAVNELVQEVADLLGGATVYEQARGCWVDEGKMECEPVKVIEAGHQCHTPKDLRRLSTALVRYAQKARQKAIAVRNNKFYIAESKDILDLWLRESLKEEVPG